MKHHPITGFSGSYASSDIDFVLKRVEIASTPVDQKEVAIQTGARHYSEMISDEARPDQRYLDIFRSAWSETGDRIATETMSIAAHILGDTISGNRPSEITLCSLVRAGAPLGVLLNRALRHMGADVAHYGVSIIRDRGLDRNAMNRITSMRDPEGIVFVDGWTGKGAIARELRSSWTEISGLAPRLAVLADPCGEADLAGSHEDWLIPSGILGANISGLISRSILNSDVIGPDDFHGFIPVDHLADIDFSAAFIEDIWARMSGQLRTKARISKPRGREIDDRYSARLSARAQEAVSLMMAEFETSNANRVKPGIAEATRAVLRRKPRHVLLSSDTDNDLAALIHLCRQGGVEHSVRPDLTGPYRAVTIIEKAN